MPKNQKIRLTGPQKIWLESIYSKIKRGEPVNKRSLIVELLDKLPSDFNPAEIDSRLLRGGIKITLIGIAIIDPNSELIKKTNNVMQGIRKVLLENPKKEVIDVYDVSFHTGLLNKEAAVIFERLSYLGMFQDSGTSYGPEGWLSINIGERAFENYLKYESIEDIIEDIVENDDTAILSGQGIHDVYDVVLSFAEEDRLHAQSLAEELKKKKVHVFYDKYEVATLWGKDLYTHLSDIYQNKARFCVIFCSKHYASKLWTNHEREAAQARAFREKSRIHPSNTLRSDMYSRSITDNGRHKLV